MNGATTASIGAHFEWTGSTSTMKKYYYEGGSRIAMRVGSSTRYYLLGDHLGSTAITANSSGALYSELRYMPWGETRYTSGTTPTTYRFTGQREEDYINLIQMGSRWYDPALGRWAQPDTIVPEAVQGIQAWDRYAYVNNSPVNFNDPSGHCLILCTAAIGAGIGAIAGAVTYTLANPYNFDPGEMLVAAGAGAIAGALIGSGIGILAAPTTAIVATAANAMVGAGTGAAGSAAGYTVTSPNSFETTPFIATTVVGGAVGGVSAITPLSSVGVAAKTATYITGSETLYALRTDNWTVEGAQRAAIYGAIGAGFDVGGTLAVGGQPSSLANLYPSTRPLGYVPPPSYYDIMASAARARAGTGVLNASSGWVSGISESITTTLLDHQLRYEER